MRAVHPGEILREELDTLGLSANALARALGVPVNRITLLLHGQRGVTADTALRLARYFGTTPQVVAESAADLGTPPGGDGDGPRDRRAGPAPATGGVAGRKKRDGSAEPCAFARGRRGMSWGVDRPPPSS